MPYCYHEPSVISIALGCFLILGTALSYSLQIVSLVRTKTSRGISFISLGMGLSAGLFGFTGNAVLSWQNILCCRFFSDSIRPGECLVNNIVLIQLATGPIFMLIIYSLFLKYFDFRRSEAIPDETQKDRLTEFRSATILLASSLTLILLSMMTCFILYYGGLAEGETVEKVARGLGIAGAGCIFIQWFPQIYTVFKLGDSGSLSVPMIVLQAPGAFLVVYFQLSSPTPQWSSYIAYGVSGCEIVFLLCLIGFFKLRTASWYRGPGSRDPTPVYLHLNNSAEFGEDYLTDDTPFLIDDPSAI
eukprot:TRINITY_DN7969_c0_g1_i1.p1 TRINITY_DN7969_c0_g1~~TRINITY_DN7969_c0_g1_i1.p1  ORF type:complete len:302 (-),score=40.05 TRINITY_DN7969_c0_g1_i1:163-1068(-)